ncbi:MAG: hypothetical protein RBS99_12060 [Rhodospirillales bacterium]|jgi:hypothetical protein|nr:hypothetical protein [Rhodospirillales bacterium]
MSEAERARRYRNRQILGVQLVTVEIDQTTADNLVARGLLDPDAAGDRDALADVLLRLARATPLGPRGASARISKLFGAPPD